MTTKDQERQAIEKIRKPEKMHMDSQRSTRSRKRTGTDTEK